MTDSELQIALRRMTDLLIAVGTGGPRIDDVNGKYRELREQVQTEMQQRGLELKISFGDLWEWYGRYNGGVFPTWRSRRLFVGEILNSQIEVLKRPAGAARFDKIMQW